VAGVSISVSTEPVEYSTEAIPIEATGILRRQAEAELSYKSGGVVGEVLVRAGQSVR
jgi:multidrug efflux pump subunit AcrA (membrane-fusion protein)